MLRPEWFSEPHLLGQPAVKCLVRVRLPCTPKSRSKSWAGRSTPIQHSIARSKTRSHGSPPDIIPQAAKITWTVTARHPARGQRSRPGAPRHGSGDGCEQAGEVFAAGAAGAQVRRDARVAPFGCTGALFDDGVDVDVQHFHRLLASHVPRIGPQELVKRLPSAHDIPGSSSSRYP